MQFLIKDQHWFCPIYVDNLFFHLNRNLMIWSLRKMCFDHLLWYVVIFASLEGRGDKPEFFFLLWQTWNVQNPLWKQKKTGLGLFCTTLSLTLLLKHQNTCAEKEMWLVKKETLVKRFFKYSGGFGKSRNVFCFGICSTTHVPVKHKKNMSLALIQ